MNNTIETTTSRSSSPMRAVSPNHANASTSEPVSAALDLFLAEPQAPTSTSRSIADTPPIALAEPAASGRLASGIAAGVHTASRALRASEKMRRADSYLEKAWRSVFKVSIEILEQAEVVPNQVVYEASLAG